MLLAVICGDFNVDIQNKHNKKSRSMLLNYLLSYQSLYVISQSSLSNGPDYTFFNNAHHSTIDYIIASSSISECTSSCFTHPHHSLNFSDHLDCATLPTSPALPVSQNDKLGPSCRV